MVRTQVQLTQKQAETLRRLAAREKVSMAEIIRRAIDRAAQDDLMPDRDELMKRAMAAAGSIDSDITDMSIRHHEYVAEAFGK